MIVADTSALVSLASVGLLDTVLQEFTVSSTETVREELAETSDYEDSDGDAAAAVENELDRIEIQDVEAGFTSSRVDAGEASCVRLANDLDAAFLLTDDLRALPELQAVVEAKVAISPIVLKALVEREVLEREEALATLEELTARRDWLGAPIYRRARGLFE